MAPEKYTGNQTRSAGLDQPTQVARQPLQISAVSESIHVAVNLATRQIKSDNLVAVVERALASSGLPPRGLVLEVTEHSLIEDQTGAADTLQQLSELGVRSALDDFGTGYSSLSYLQEFPFDVLKINRSFVLGLLAQRDKAALVKAIVAMADSLGLDVVGHPLNPTAFGELLTVGSKYVRPEPLRIAVSDGDSPLEGGSVERFS